MSREHLRAVTVGQKSLMAELLKHPNVTSHPDFQRLSERATRCQNRAEAQQMIYRLQDARAPKAKREAKPVSEPTRSARHHETWVLCPTCKQMCLPSRPHSHPLVTIRREPAAPRPAAPRRRRPDGPVTEKQHRYIGWLLKDRTVQAHPLFPKLSLGVSECKTAREATLVITQLLRAQCTQLDKLPLSFLSLIDRRQAVS